MSEEKQTFGNPAINDCMAYMTATLGYSPSGGTTKNRRYCNLLLNIMSKDYPNDPPEHRLKLIIRQGGRGWYSRQMDGFQWLFYNYGKIINEIKAKQQVVVQEEPKQDGRYVELPDGRKVKIG